MKTTVFSKRYYCDEDTIVNFVGCKAAIRFLRDVIIRSYNAYYYNKTAENSSDDILGQAQVSLYDYMRYISGLGSLYINSLEPFVKAIFNSQLTNYTNHIEHLESDAAQIEKHMQELEKSLENKRAVKQAIIDYTRSSGSKWTKPYPGCTIKVDKNGMLKGRGIPSQYYRKYENALDQMIHKLSTDIKNMKFAASRKRRMAEQMKSRPMPRAIFGSKKLYKQKDTVGNTQEWHDEFEFARYHNISFAGVKRSPNGNYVVKWDETTHDLTFVLPDGGETVFKDFLPVKYTKEFMDHLVNNNEDENSVGYTIELKKDSKGREYFIVKATFDLPEKTRINYATVDGVISADLNADRIAWANIGPNGEYLAHGVIPMKLDGLNSGQRKIVMGTAVSKLADICVEAHKPLVIENLDAAAMRENMKYKNKKRNRIISEFAVNILIQYIYSQAYRKEFIVYQVNPVYTSLISKVVHMRKYGVSVHEGAAYEIGLRFLGLWTDIPEKYIGIVRKYPDKYFFEYDRYMHRWDCVYNAVKTIRPHAFFLDVPEYDPYVKKKPGKDAGPDEPKRFVKSKLLKWFKEHDEIFTTPGKKYLAKFGIPWTPSQKKKTPATPETNQPAAVIDTNPFAPAPAAALSA